MILLIRKMFRKIILLSKQNYNQRFFSSCKADELTSKLNQQKHYLETINRKINTLTIMSFVNFICILIF